MEKSIVLVLVGIVLIVLGVFVQIGIVTFTTIDTTPPTVVYMFPYDSWVGTETDFIEIVAYVKDDTPGISSVVYIDTNFPSGLPLYRAIQPQSKFKIFIPDVTDDGAVDSEDKFAIEEHFGAVIGDPEYDEKYDLNNDGIIDSLDAVILLNGLYTYVYTAIYTASPLVSDTFKFTVVDSYMNYYETTGFYSINNSVQELSGKWYINGIEVYDDSCITLSVNDVVISFESEQGVEANAKAIVNGKVYELEKISATEWETQVFLEGYCVLQLVASTVDGSQINSITISVDAPSILEVNNLVLVLMISGVLLAVYGLMKYKKEKTFY